MSTVGQNPTQILINGPSGSNITGIEALTTAFPLEMVPISTISNLNIPLLTPTSTFEIQVGGADVADYNVTAAGGWTFTANGSTTSQFVFNLPNVSAHENVFTVQGNATASNNAIVIANGGDSTNVATKAEFEVFLTGTATGHGNSTFQCVGGANPLTTLFTGVDITGGLQLNCSAGNILLLTATGNVTSAPNSANALVITNPAGGSAVNWLQISGSATGVALTIKAIGSDNNIDMQFLPAGSGTIWFANAGCFAANSNVATALTNVGPVGSHTTVQEWLIIKDTAGTVRYIPCF